MKLFLVSTILLCFILFQSGEARIRRQCNCGNTGNQQQQVSTPSCSCSSVSQTQSCSCQQTPQYSASQSSSNCNCGSSGSSSLSSPVTIKVNTAQCAPACQQSCTDQCQQLQAYQAIATNAIANCITQCQEKCAAQCSATTTTTPSPVLVRLDISAGCKPQCDTQCNQACASQNQPSAQCASECSSQCSNACASSASSYNSCASQCASQCSSASNYGNQQCNQQCQNSCNGYSTTSTTTSAPIIQIVLQSSVLSSGSQCEPQCENACQSQCQAQQQTALQCAQACQTSCISQCQPSTVSCAPTASNNQSSCNCQQNYTPCGNNQCCRKRKESQRLIGDELTTNRDQATNRLPIMWPTSSRTDRGANEIYDKFSRNFHEGWSKMREAIEADEISKRGNNLNQKLKTAELYKEGRALFKEAKNHGIMDFPENRRAEVRENREKMDRLDKSAQERICAICDEIQPNVRKQRTLSGSNVRPASPRTAPVTRNVASTSQQITSQGISRASLLKGVDKAVGERLLDEILDNTGVRLEDVAGCELAKRSLEEAVILPSLNPGLFSGLRQPVKGILLFGPPGNGKTLLAKAVAGEAKQMFFNISASSLTSKWVGDSEKTIRGLFQIARNAQPSIIFIDEIDSILCQRSEKDAEVSRRMKTEFLIQFDGATSSPDDRILVIGATNRPFELDDAVLRRFPKRIMLGLPDESARCDLIERTLRKHKMDSGISSREIRDIAYRTSGFSNSDLVALCKEAAMVPIRSIDKSRLATTDTSKLRSLRCSDFIESLRVIRPSTSDTVMTKLQDFAKNFGCS
ncbi:unnamed protein product [Caenorhabditis angaria]|uniref:microtubule-severing ATPase n=1 Tax=Caenorhabditis angaria TaxID=860376 RepID=A0A9P1N742_9PELO|nr:unnamed protein product [Caenorhabditis angaria]